MAFRGLVYVLFPLGYSFLDYLFIYLFYQVGPGQWLTPLVAETLFIVLLLKLEYNCNNSSLIKVSYNNNLVSG